LFYAWVENYFFFFAGAFLVALRTGFLATFFAVTFFFATAFS